LAYIYIEEWLQYYILLENWTARDFGEVV